MIKLVLLSLFSCTCRHGSSSVIGISDDRIERGCCLDSIGAVEKIFSLCRWWYSCMICSWIKCAGAFKEKLFTCWDDIGSLKSLLTIVMICSMCFFKVLKIIYRDLF